MLFVCMHDVYVCMYVCFGYVLYMCVYIHVYIHSILLTRPTKVKVQYPVSSLLKSVSHTHTNTHKHSNTTHTFVHHSIHKAAIYMQTNIHT